MGDLAVGEELGARRGTGALNAVEAGASAEASTSRRTKTPTAGVKSVTRTKSSQNTAEGRKRAAVSAGRRGVTEARRSGSALLLGGTKGGVSKARATGQLAASGAKHRHDASKRVNPSIEAKMELEAFLGTTQSVAAVELAAREAEDVFEPDLSTLNPFAPPKMASFTFQSLVDPPADLLPTVTGTPPTVDDMMFDSWVAVDMYGRGADPFTNTSTPQFMPGLELPSTIPLFAMNQSEYSALFGSPGYNTMVNVDPILFGSVKEEVEKRWCQSDGKTKRPSATGSAKIRKQRKHSYGGSGAGQKSTKTPARDSPPKHSPTKVTEVSPKTQQDADAQKKIAEAHMLPRKGLKTNSSPSPPVQPKSARSAGNANKLTCELPLRELSSSTGTSLCQPGGAYPRSQPTTNAFPSSSVSDDDKKALIALMEIIIHIPDATRENVRNSLLRLKKSAKLRDGKLRSAIKEDPDTSYIDRSVANLLYHRYSGDGLSGTSKKALVDKASGREVNSVMHERQDRPPAVPA